MCNFTENKTATMEHIAEYRAQILQALCDARDPLGNPRLTEAQAKKLVEEFSDEQLNDGMLFNTPEEVAQLLLEAGL